MNSTFDKTEEKIITSTLKTLAEEGLAKATTAKIASNACVSEVTLFRKFKSKDNLLDITKKYYLNYFLDEIDCIFKYDENKSFEVLLKEIGWNLLKFFEKNLDIVKVAIDESIATNDKNIIEIVSEKTIKNLTEIFQKAINQNKIRRINPQTAAFNIYSIIFQSIILLRIYGGESIPNLEEKIDSFIDILFYGISKENKNEDI